LDKVLGSPVLSMERTLDWIASWMRRRKATRVVTKKMGGGLSFSDSSSAGHATIDNAGAVTLEPTSTAANATITNRSGGAVFFWSFSDGGQAQLINLAGGIFDLEFMTSSTFTIGSLSGAGKFDFGSDAVTVGGNNLSTTISGSSQMEELQDPTAALRHSKLVSAMGARLLVREVSTAGPAPGTTRRPIGRI
jgi:hypothetical protein